MNKLNKIIACMKEFGMKPKIGSFESKLVIQKAVCLLELIGLNAGYGFSMYIRGPYSPELTKDLYENRDAVENLRANCALSSAEKCLVAKVAEASDNLDPTLLEIMATYAFLSKKCNLDNRKAVPEIKRLKPFFSHGKIAVGISRAKGLFPLTEKEIKGIRKEFALWESAALSDMKF